jgi:hypothetical protein
VSATLPATPASRSLPSSTGSFPTAPSTVEPRPPADVPTLVASPGSFVEAARFLRDDPSTAYDLLLDLVAVDRLKLDGPALVPRRTSGSS